MKPRDLLFESHYPLILVHPLTPVGKAWVAENYPGGSWIIGGMVADPGSAEEILSAALRAGLTAMGFSEIVREA